MQFYIYGKHPVIMALQNPRRKILNVLCLDKAYAEHSSAIGKHKFKIVDPKTMEKALPYGALHQGIAALVASLESMDIEVCLEKPRVLILDQLQDPHNIGAIVRSAVAFGITNIIVPSHNFPEESGVIAKSSSGYIEHTNIIRVSNIKYAIDYLKKHGFWVMGLDAQGDKMIWQEDLRGNIALVIGAEGKGIRRLVKESCDFLLTIPTSVVESLNVSNAAAIMFYELARQVGLPLH